MNRPYLRKRRIHPVDVYRDYISELDKYIDYLESQLKDHEVKEQNESIGFFEYDFENGTEKYTSTLDQEKEYTPIEQAAKQWLSETDTMQFAPWELLAMFAESQPQHFLLPTDEEIGKYLLSLYGEGMLNKNAAILFCEWLKTKIKGIPKELSEEDVDAILEDVGQLTDFRDELHYKSTVIDIYKAIIQHLTEKE